VGRFTLLLQLGVPAMASLSFLGIVAGVLEHAEASLIERKREWDRLQQHKREEELEALAMQRRNRARSRVQPPEAEIPPDQASAA